MRIPPCVPELLLPGSNIIAGDVNAASRFRTYIGLLESQLETAAVTLMMFEGAVGEPRSNDPSSPSYSARREEILKESTSGLAPLDADQYLGARFDAEVQAKRELWASGTFPESWKDTLLKTYAREFVYALDNVKNLLHRLAQEPGAPSDVGRAKAALLEVLPALRGVRNSLHHLEDRALGRDRNKQPIRSKAVTSGPLQMGEGA